MTLRAQFAKTVINLMERDEKIIVLLGDIGVYAFRQAFERWPERTINCGVAECGMVGMAAGLAMGGFYPIVSTIDSFLVRRAYEFIALDFGLQNLPGLFVTVGGSVDYAKLGPTHQCPEAPTLMAQIPGMHIRMPITDMTVDLAISKAVKGRQLSYVRLEESQSVQEPAPERKVLHLPIPGARNGISTGDHG